MMILINIVIYLLGVITGIVLMALASVESYKKGSEDARGGDNER